MQPDAGIFGGICPGAIYPWRNVYIPLCRRTCIELRHEGCEQHDVSRCCWNANFSVAVTARACANWYTVL